MAKCRICEHSKADHYGSDGGTATSMAEYGRHRCHPCDTSATKRQRQADGKSTRFWMGVAVIGVLIGGVVLQTQGRHDAAFSAGESWANVQLAQGYEAANPHDDDPCDSKAVASASSGYRYASWMDGCEAATGR
jgi:hypothetical protein